MRLTKAERKALELLHLGGIEALRTDLHQARCRTIDALVRKGLLESLDACTLPDGTVRRGGLTALGKQVARGIAEEWLNNLTAPREECVP